MRKGLCNHIRMNGSMGLLGYEPSTPAFDDTGCKFLNHDMKNNGAPTPWNPNGAPPGCTIVDATIEGYSFYKITSNGLYTRNLNVYTASGYSTPITRMLVFFEQGNITKNVCYVMCKSAYCYINNNGTVGSKSNMSVISITALGSNAYKFDLNVTTGAASDIGIYANDASIVNGSYYHAALHVY